MSGKWVDIRSYFGPDRRRRRGLLHLVNRRRDNAAGDIPPLGAVLRRLRLQLNDGDHDRSLQLLAGAIAEANRLGYRRCCAALQGVERILRQPNYAGALAAAEAQLTEAMAHADAHL